MAALKIELIVVCESSGESVSCMFAHSSSYGGKRLWLTGLACLFRLAFVLQKLGQALRRAGICTPMSAVTWTVFQEVSYAGFGGLASLKIMQKGCQAIAIAYRTAGAGLLGTVLGVSVQCYLEACMPAWLCWIITYMIEGGGDKYVSRYI